MEIAVAAGWAVHSLFMCSKKDSRRQDPCIFFEQMNNLRTVTRLGVDKFTSRSVIAEPIAAACELVDTLRLEAEEEEHDLPPPFFWKEG